MRFLFFIFFFSLSLNGCRVPLPNNAEPLKVVFSACESVLNDKEKALCYRHALNHLYQKYDDPSIDAVYEICLDWRDWYYTWKDTPAMLLSAEKEQAFVSCVNKGFESIINRGKSNFHALLPSLTLFILPASLLFGEAASPRVPASSIAIATTSVGHRLECGGAHGDPKGRPGLEVRYEWQAGSLPPVSVFSNIGGAAERHFVVPPTLSNALVRCRAIVRDELGSETVSGWSSATRILLAVPPYPPGLPQLLRLFDSSAPGNMIKSDR